MWDEAGCGKTFCPAALPVGQPEFWIQRYFSKWIKSNIGISLIRPAVFNTIKKKAFSLRAKNSLENFPGSSCRSDFPEPGGEHESFGIFQIFEKLAVRRHHKAPVLQRFRITLKGPDVGIKIRIFRERITINLGCLGFSLPPQF